MKLTRWGSSVGEFPRGGTLIGLFYDPEVGNGERFPHLAEACPVEAQPPAAPVQGKEDDPTRPAPIPPGAVRVSDNPIVVEVTDELASKRHRQLFKRTTAIVPHPLFQA